MAFTLSFHILPKLKQFTYPVFLQHVLPVTRIRLPGFLVTLALWWGKNILNYNFFLLLNWEWHSFATFLPVKQKQNQLLTSINFLLSVTKWGNTSSVYGKCQDGSYQAKTLGKRIESEEWILRKQPIIAKTWKYAQMLMQKCYQRNC